MIRLVEGNEIILASGSPRRQEMLRAVNLPFRVVVPGVDESPFPGEQPEAMVRRLAAAKARDAAVRFPANWVVGADTSVVIDGRVLGKPQDKAEAFEMLSLIAGRTHRVVGGFALMRESPRVFFAEVDETEVEMAALTPDEIKAYIETGEPMDKAGAYAIQGIGASLVKGIKGSYTNVVGLNLARLLELMREAGAITFS